MPVSRVLGRRTVRPFAATRCFSADPFATAGSVPEGQGTATGPFLGGTWEENGYEVSSNNGAPKIRSPWNKWFPYEPVPFSPKLGPYKVWCEAGEVYHWCACGESRTQPWCECAGDFNASRGFAAVPYVPRHTGWKLMNGSKHSSQPVFNGTCWMVWVDVNILPACVLGFSGCFVFSVFYTWMSHP